MATMTRTWEQVEAERTERANRVAETVFVYCRSSFVDRKKVDRQDRQGVEWAKARWPEADVVVFKDDGHSGGSDDRPQWNEMKARIAAGEADAVVTYTVSRITRDVTIGEQFAKLCRSTGIKDIWMAGADKPVSIREADMGEWRQHIIMATQQREDAKVSSRNALERNCVDGVPNGKAAFGYVNARHPDDERATWEIDEDKAPILRQIFDWAEAGVTMTGIATRLNEQGVEARLGGRKWWTTTVKWILTNPVYIGRQVYGGVLYPPSDRWESLVTEEQWDKVQRRIAEASKDASSWDVRRKWWLPAVLRCCTCGTSMTGTRINHNRKGGATPAFKCREQSCELRMSWSPADKIELYFAEILVGRANSPEFAALVDDVDIVTDRRSDIVDRIEAIDAKRAKLAESFAADLITGDMMTQALEPLIAERSACAAVLDSLQARDDGPAPSDLIGITTEEFESWDLADQIRAAQIIFSEIVVLPAKGRRQSGGKLVERYEIKYRSTL